MGSVESPKPSPRWGFDSFRVGYPGLRPGQGTDARVAGFEFQSHAIQRDEGHRTVDLCADKDLKGGGHPLVFRLKAW